MKPVELLYLSQEDVSGLELPNQQLTEVLEKTLIEHADHEIEMPPKPGVHPTYENTFIHAMPAYLKRSDICGIKWVSGFPRNYEYGLPNIAGLLILNDTKTGMPLAVMDCRWITTIRTALISAICAKHCAPVNPVELAIVGCGLQGRYHAHTISEALPTIETIRFTDVIPASMDRFEDQVATKFTGKLVRCEQTRGMHCWRRRDCNVHARRCSRRQKRMVQTWGDRDWHRRQLCLGRRPVAQCRQVHCRRHSAGSLF